jgi:hypothetical protein
LCASTTQKVEVCRVVDGEDVSFWSRRAFDQHQGIAEGGRHRFGEALQTTRVLRMSRIAMRRRGDTGERDAGWS